MPKSLERYDLVKPLFKNNNKAGDAERGALNLSIDLVRRRSDGLLCVKKVIAKDRACEEINALMRLRNHPLVNHIMDFGTTGIGVNYTATLFLDYCDLGSLQGVIRRSIGEKRRKLPEAFLWHVFKSVAKALAYLHYGINEYEESKKDKQSWDFVLHRDLKPHNIFLKTDPDRRKSFPRVVLGDFGASTTQSNLQEQPLSCRYPSVLTPAYTPPEAPRYDRKSDVWALGVSIQEMMAVERFNGARMILEPDLRGSGYTPELIKCVIAARRVNHGDRLSAPELVVELSRRYKAAVERGAIPREPRSLESWLFVD